MCFISKAPLLFKGKFSLFHVCIKPFEVELLNGGEIVSVLELLAVCFVSDSTQQQPATTRQLGEYTSFREKHIYISGLQKNLVAKNMKR